MDFVTLKGIQNRTSVELDDLYLFVIKQVVDNAIDYFERQRNLPDYFEPKVSISIIGEWSNENDDEAKSSNNKSHGGLLRIRVSNNKPPPSPSSSEKALLKKKSVFSKKLVQQIFIFGEYFSSKRNQFRITRGALGDAFKELLCIPYALAFEQCGRTSWDYPLIIRDAGVEYSVNVVVDKIKQNVTPYISSRCIAEDKDLVEIEICVPTKRRNEHELEGVLEYDNLNADINSRALEYAIFNTHITFDFTIKLHKDRTSSLYHYPRSQPIKKSWTSLSSIHSYSYNEFENLLFGLATAPGADVYTHLFRVFREATQLKKTNRTLGDIRHNEVLRRQLYYDLRHALPPKDKLDLPFDTSPKTRKEAILKTVSLCHNVADIKYGNRFGLYNSSDSCGDSGGTRPSSTKIDNDICFPYFIEVAVITVTPKVDERTGRVINFGTLVYESLNNSPGISGYFVFQGNSLNTLQWKTRNGRVQHDYNVNGILMKYGYASAATGQEENEDMYEDNEDELPTRVKKPNRIIVINLVSPRLEYLSYGKSSINLAPFSKTLGQLIYDTCCATRTSGNRKGDYDELGNRKPTAKELLVELLREREKAVRRNPNIGYWTQSTVFYTLRKQKLVPYGIKKYNRKAITAAIKEVCEDLLHKKRHELRIIASVRAQLYYSGQWHDVDFDGVSSLIKKGTDMIIIEKEGVPKLLADYADKARFGLLNSRGFLTEYAESVYKLAQENGANIGILTDLDASGLLIAKQFPEVFRIGVDFEMLEYLGLDIEEVEERYEPTKTTKKHLAKLHALVETELDQRLYDYVSHDRVEIDSIIADDAAGAKAIWDYIVMKMTERFNIRDYNRSIDFEGKEDEYRPTALTDHIEKIDAFVRSKTDGEIEKIKSKLKDFNGFIPDVPAKEQEYCCKLRQNLENNLKVQRLISSVKDLI